MREGAGWGQSAHSRRDPTGDPRTGRVRRGDSGPGWGGARRSSREEVALRFRLVLIGYDGTVTLTRHRRFIHGSNSRMAATMDSVLHPTRLSAASDTTDETFSCLQRRIATMGLR